jgi:hypothetical protein
VFAVADGGSVYHYDGAAWTRLLGGTTAIVPVWGSSATDIYGIGEAGSVLRYDGTSWNKVAEGNPSLARNVWAYSPSDMFQIGYDPDRKAYLVYHFDGRSWTEMDVSSTHRLRDIWGSSPSDVFAVGLGDTVLHYDGESWRPMNASEGYHFQAVWGTSSSDVFVVGISSTILHYDGNEWSVMYRDEDGAHLNDVWGSSPSDVYAVGSQGGYMLHYDGKSWKRVDTPTDRSLAAIWGSSATNVFVVGSSWAGEGCVILHFDGDVWRSMDCGTTNPLGYIWGTSATDVYIVGSYGTLLHHTGIPRVSLAARPDSGQRGDSLKVVLRGKGLDQATAVSFGTGVRVNSFEISGPEEVAVDITISRSAPQGRRYVSVAAPGGIAFVMGEFTVGKTPLIAAFGRDLSSWIWAIALAVLVPLSAAAVTVLRRGSFGLAGVLDEVTRLLAHLLSAILTSGVLLFLAALIVTFSILASWSHDGLAPSIMYFGLQAIAASAGAVWVWRRKRVLRWSSLVILVATAVVAGFGGWVAGGHVITRGGLSLDVIGFIMGANLPPFIVGTIEAVLRHRGKGRYAGRGGLTQRS